MATILTVGLFGFFGFVFLVLVSDFPIGRLIN